MLAEAMSEENTPQSLEKRKECSDRIVYWAGLDEEGKERLEGVTPQPQSSKYKRTEGMEKQWKRETFSTYCS